MSPLDAIERRPPVELRNGYPVPDYGDWDPYAFTPRYGVADRPRDPTEHLRHDGEWHADITLAHEVVEFEGYGVPLFEGDVERIEWERARGLR